MKYKIGTVSKLLGISSEALRLYERSGILSTARDDTNGKYRLYSYLDITALMRARTYHNYGFSLKQTETLINTDDTEIVKKLYHERREEIKEELKRKQLLSAYMDKTIELIDSISCSLDKITVSERPAMYRFEYARDNKFFIKSDSYSKFQFWVNLAPITFSALRNDWEALCAGKDVSVSAMGITEEFAQQFGITQDDNIKYYPKCTCLYTVVKLTGEEANATDYLSALIEYVSAHNCKVCGDCISRTFMSLNKREKYTRYRQIWLPIDQCDKNMM